MFCWSAGRLPTARTLTPASNSPEPAISHSNCCFSRGHLAWQMGLCSLLDQADNSHSLLVPKSAFQGRHISNHCL